MSIRGLRNALRTFTQHPGYVAMRSVARLDGVRNAVIALQRLGRGSLNEYLRGVDSQRSPFFDSVDTAAIANGVERDGFAFGLQLPAATVRELVEFAQTHPCFIDRNPALGFLPAEIEQARERLGRRFLLAQYFNLQAQSPLVDQLSRDPVLLAIAARYLRTPPTLVGVNLFWSYPANLSADHHSFAAQMFHYDLDDFKFIKFFFYLTDVDANSGPHVAVKTSHRNKRHARLSDKLKVRRYSDAEVIAMYGAEQIISITGPAGMGFAEDTICIHKGERPITNERLILQFQYALNDWGIQRDEKDASELKMM